MKLKLISFYLLLVYFLLMVFTVFEPIAYFRIVDASQATYPLIWLVPVFKFIELIVSTPLRLMPSPGGFEGLGQTLMLVFILIFAVSIGVLLYGYRVLRRKGFYLLCITVALGMFLLFSSEIVRSLVNRFSEKASVEHNAANKSLETSNIRFILLKSNLVNKEPSLYFPDKQRMIFEIVLSVVGVPADLPNFKIFFNEDDFEEYQLYGSWGCRCDFTTTGLVDYIEVANDAGRLTFRNPHTQVVLNSDEANSAKFKLSVELKNSQPPAEIGFSPKIDIDIKDELDYANNNPVGYGGKDIVKTDYPAFFVN